MTRNTLKECSLRDLCESCQKLWGEERISIELRDRYKNAFNALKTTDSLLIQIALRAYKNVGITPKIIPMRGGYDGAVIFEKGVPCPNIFTGAHNFHSIYEYLPVKSLKAAAQVIQEVVILAAKS